MFNLGFYGEVIGQERQLVSFELEDQFEKVYTDEDYKHQIIVVISSDKGGNKYNPIWSEAILKLIHDNGMEKSIEVIGIANLKGVPFFLKGYIKGKLPKDPDNRLLLDWSGQFAKAYKFMKNVCNIAIFDQGGKLVLITYGSEMENHKLHAIGEMLIKIGKSETGSGNTMLKED